MEQGRPERCQVGDVGSSNGAAKIFITVSPSESWYGVKAKAVDVGGNIDWALLVDQGQ